MTKKKLCPLCLEKGKEMPVCPNSGVYCHFHQQTEQWNYHLKLQRKPKTKGAN